MRSIDVNEIFKKRERAGWVPESEAKMIFEASGIPIVRFAYATDLKEAVQSAESMLIDAVIRFSELAMDLQERFESMEVNPFICSPERCAAADVRIMLKD